MSPVPSKVAPNRLLAALPARDRKVLLAAAEPIDIEFGQVLCEPGAAYRYLYFPLTGFVSLVTTVAGHRPLEMGLIGSEGMLGATVALGVTAVPLRGIVQGSGTALRFGIRQFQTLITEHPALHRILDRYVYVLMAQLARTAACTRFHDVDRRLARWLLMTHDRAHADHFQLTHQFLADMLGVRRSGVTLAAGRMQASGLISYSRGDIRILYRTGLEAVSCTCYAEALDDYSAVMPANQG